MAKLILSMDGVVLKEIPLSKERLTIGRKPHNDIQIDNLTFHELLSTSQHFLSSTLMAPCSTRRRAFC